MCKCAEGQRGCRRGVQGGKRAAGSGKRNNGMGSDASGQRSHQGWALDIQTLSWGGSLMHPRVGVGPHAYLCLWLLSMPRSVMPRGSAGGASRRGERGGPVRPRIHGSRGQRRVQNTALADIAPHLLSGSKQRLQKQSTVDLPFITTHPGRCHSTAPGPRGKERPWPPRWRHQSPPSPPALFQMWK